MWHQTAGDAAVFSLGYHCFDQRLIIIELEMAGTGALIKAIVALNGKDFFRYKTRFAELAINIGGEHEIIFGLNQVMQFQIELGSRRLVAVDLNMLCPVGPFSSSVGKG